MILRQSLLLGVATAALAGVGHAQTRGQSRDDLLDALTRHIQICAEIADTQQRLSCYDRLQNQVGGVSAPAPTPTPLQAAPAPSMQSPPLSTGSSISSAPLSSQPLSPQPLSPPLSPQPLGVPGGGVATLGGPAPPLGAPPSSQDPNAAFDPSSSTFRVPEAIGCCSRRCAAPVRSRIRYSSTPQPLVTRAPPTSPMAIHVPLVSHGDAHLQLAEGPQHRMECTFMNAGRPVSTDYLGPVYIQPGEQITTELIGPPTTTYIDSTNCKVVSP